MTLAQCDRLLIWVALGGLVLLCWLYLVRMSLSMGSMDGMMNEAMGLRPWQVKDFILMFAMWAIMMIGMMVPTAMRSVMVFSRIGAKASAQGQSFTPTLWFVTGYGLIWVFFSFGATLLQWGLEQAALLSPMMVSTSIYLGSSILILSGLWQLSPMKDTCLRHCQSPALYIANNFRPGISGALKLGIKHGLYCLGCCWVLMGLLFVGGVMNLLWIAAITGFVLAEKLLPANLQISRLSGCGLILSGLAVLVWKLTT
jgi:predicted metal-binding membrane protein